MTYSFRKIIAPAFAIILFVTAAFCTAAAQEKKTPQTAGVDNTKMGAYRAIAQHAFLEFQRATARPPLNLPIAWSEYGTKARTTAATWR